MIRSWMVMAGDLLSRSHGGGGLEFFGPFTEAEAKRVLANYQRPGGPPIAEAIQLLHHQAARAESAE